MKREEIKTIFPDATDEQLKAVMDLNGADVEKAKAKVTALEAEAKDKKEAFDKLNSEFEALKSANASGEDWKAKFEALQAENLAKEKQAEADRILAEKNADIEKRFSMCVGEKKFSHDAIKADYLKKFSAALESEEYKGKGDADIFHALTKDDAAAFQGVTAVKLAGGTPQGTGGKYTSKEEIMSIKDMKTRHSEMLANSHLFPELNK
jgi:ribosomal protein L12E/L44/L45/RPP1/RPP2